MSDPRTKRLETYWRIISKLETKRKSRIYSLIHCGDKDNHICGPTFAQLLSQRSSMGNVQTLELLVHSPGGSADIAYQMVRFFRRHSQKFNVIVPMTAKSAATLMCLGADGIYMGELADLGPMDVQIHDPVEKGEKAISPLDEFKSTEFLRDYGVEVLDYFTALIIRRSGMSVKEALRESIPFTTGIMRPLYEQLDPLEIGEYKRALAIGEEYATRLLALAKNPKRKEIVEALVYKYPSHDFAIDAIEARALGLPVHTLDPLQENMLLSVLIDIVSNGESVHGFAKVPPAKAAPTPAKSSKKKQPAAQPQPTPIAASR